MSKENKQDNDKFISLIIVVNTIPVTITINENAPLKAAAEKALEETKNSGRPLQDWEMKLDDKILDLDKKIKSYDFPNNQELFLSLKAGVGGNRII